MSNIILNLSCIISFTWSLCMREVFNNAVNVVLKTHFVSQRFIPVVDNNHVNNLFLYLLKANVSLVKWIFMQYLFIYFLLPTYLYLYALCIKLYQNQYFEWYCKLGGGWMNKYAYKTFKNKRCKDHQCSV